MSARSLDSIGQRVKLVRTRLGMTQGELAKVTGEKQPNISKLERGDIQTTTAIARLADALHVSARWLELGEGDEAANWTPPQHAPTGVSVSTVAQDLIHPKKEDEPTTCTWEFILSGSELPPRFSAAAPDDALAPVTPRGTGYLFAAGTAPPADGTVVIVQAGNGRRYMRLFFAGTGDEWEARARDPAHRALHSVRDELVLLASATHRAGGQG